jgi:hypothetical protein
MGEMRNRHKIVVGNREGAEPLGRPMRRWKGNIKTVLRETGCEGVNLIHLAYDSPLAGFCELSDL